ncbi:hypothetical protein ACTWQN_00660 [Saccharopolyspora sp. 5N708]
MTAGSAVRHAPPADRHRIGDARNDKINNMHEAGTATNCEPGQASHGPSSEGDERDHPEPTPMVNSSTTFEDDLDAELVRAARAFLTARRLTRIGLSITALGVIAVAIVTIAVLTAELLIPPVAIWGAYAALAVGVGFWGLATGGRHLTADRLWSLQQLNATPSDQPNDSLLRKAHRLARSGSADPNENTAEQPSQQPS